jgi:hypothetical protein
MALSQREEHPDPWIACRGQQHLRLGIGSGLDAWIREIAHAAVDDVDARASRPGLSHIHWSGLDRRRVDGDGEPAGGPRYLPPADKNQRQERERGREQREAVSDRFQFLAS